MDEFLGGWVRESELLLGLIVINSGAHMQAYDVFVPQVRAALAAAVATHPTATIVWRNTPPGHANCSQIRAPLRQPQGGPLPYGGTSLSGRTSWSRRSLSVSSLGLCT